MSSKLAEEVCLAGQQIIAASGSHLPRELTQQLNHFLGWPFQAASGEAIDSNGQTTASFGTLIYTGLQVEEAAERPVRVPADTLACVIDVAETLDLEGLRAAYARIAQAKTLKKGTAVKGIVHTTITFGVIFAVTAAVPLEALADELDRLNQRTPSARWPDMVVIASRGIISYAVQFPGEATITGEFLPPAEGTLDNYVPAIYVVMVIKPDTKYAFNKMMSIVLTHLSIFAPGASLPDREAITEMIPNPALIQSGYQYNLAGNLRFVPPEFIQGRYRPQKPVLIEDKKGSTLATLQFLAWQDGGVILMRGKLPLDGLLVFLGDDALKKAGTIRREEVQISHVLPISEKSFGDMLQRIQQRTNMNVRSHPGKFVIQKFADEGTRSHFMARLFIGVLKLAESLGGEKAKFEASYHPLLTTLLSIRTAAREVSEIFADHVRKVSDGAIVQVNQQTIQISESIDRELAKRVDEFLIGATRSFKDKMQRVTDALSTNIGFLYQKDDKFRRGLEALKAVDPHFAAYLQEARQWSDKLVRARIALEHGDWRLPAVTYAEHLGTITVVEPTIEGQVVTQFVRDMMDHLMCFVEDVTVHCIQSRMPAGISVTEISLLCRPAEIPMRFQPTLAIGGMTVWQISYHQSAFEAT